MTKTNQNSFDNFELKPTNQSKGSELLNGISNLYDAINQKQVNPKMKTQNHSERSILTDSNVVSTSQLAKANFDTVKIGGKFGQLLGEPYNPFYMMIYGDRFNGKSSVAMLLAGTLSKKRNKVLYISNEEGVKASLQEKLVRLNITNPIDFVEDYNSEMFARYDAVFMDSVQTIGLKSEDFKLLKRQYPQTSFVMVFKANRDGTSKGGTDWEHDVDAIMHIEKGSATMEKNRFPNGSNGTIKIF